MIHLLLSLLKIIGILLLVLVGLLLFVILSVLFVPIRYQFSGKYDEEKNIEGTVAIHWFFHLLSVRTDYKEKVVEYSVKLFGMTLASTQKEERSKTKQAKRKRAKKKTKEKKPKREKREKQEPSVTEIGYLEDELEDETDEIEELEETVEEQKEEKPQKKTQKQTKREKKWKSRIQKIQRSFQMILGKIRNIKNNFEKYLDFYKEEETQEAIRFVKKLGKELLHHLLPRKLDATVCFGFDDPSVTGQVLAVLSLAIPIYQDHLKLYPVFNEKTLEFDARGKGYIRLGFFIWIAIRVLLDKNIKNQIQKGKTMLK